jgi:hypothetical protein
VHRRSKLDGRIVFDVHQVVHDLNGTLLADKKVSSVFRLENELIKRSDLRGP